MIFWAHQVGPFVTQNCPIYFKLRPKCSNYGSKYEVCLLCLVFKCRCFVSLLSRRSRLRQRLNAMGLSICWLVVIVIVKKQYVTRTKSTHKQTSKRILSVCLSPQCKNAIFSKTKQFRAMVSIDELQKSYRGFQWTHYWTHKIQDGGDPPSWKSTWSHFFLPIERGRSDLDKISETGAGWRVDCGDMVEIETRSRIPIWQTFGRIQWPVIPEPRITLQGAATWWIQCHEPHEPEPHATLHGERMSFAILQNVFRSIYFFLNAVLVFGERGLSYRLRYTRLLQARIRFQFMIPQESHELESNIRWNILTTRVVCNFVIILTKSKFVLKNSDVKQKLLVHRNVPLFVCATSKYVRVNPLKKWRLQ